MATGKFTVPNWAQRLIIQAVGVDYKDTTVRHEDDRNISFVHHRPRPHMTRDYIVNKITGDYVVSESGHEVLRGQVTLAPEIFS